MYFALRGVGKPRRTTQEENEDQKEIIAVTKEVKRLHGSKALSNEASFIIM